MYKIIETRSLFFTSDEVLDALVDYQCRRECLRFGETIERCSFELDNSGEIIRCQLARVGDEDDQSDRQSPRERVDVCSNIPASDIVAALIFYCRNARIPLPAAAEKSLQFIDGRFAVNLVISVDRDRSSERLGRRVNSAAMRSVEDPVICLS